MADTNYFVCTLGQAVAVNRTSPHGFETISEFLDHQAQVVPKAPAVGFPIPSKSHGKNWESVVFSMPEHSIMLLMMMLMIRQLSKSLLNAQ